jgi:hypothetical protein
VTVMVYVGVMVMVGCGGSVGSFLPQEIKSIMIITAGKSSAASFAGRKIKFFPAFFIFPPARLDLYLNTFPLPWQYHITGGLPECLPP